MIYMFESMGFAIPAGLETFFHWYMITAIALVVSAAGR